MLTEKDFETAYGPMLAKWEAKLGKPVVAELVNDMAPIERELLTKTADHQTTMGASKGHTDVIHHGIATFDAFRKKHGY